MTDQDDVFFESIKKDRDEYAIGDHKTETVKISGKLSKGEFKGIKLFILITKPNGKEELTLFPAKDGYFETPYKLDKNSDIGTYRVKGKYLKAESQEITFEVKRIKN